MDVADEVSESNCQAVKKDKTKTDNCNATLHLFTFLMFAKLFNVTEEQNISLEAFVLNHKEAYMDSVKDYGSYNQAIMLACLTPRVTLTFWF